MKNFTKNKDEYKQVGVKRNNDTRKDVSFPAKIYNSGKVKVFTFAGWITYKTLQEFKNEWRVL